MKGAWILMSGKMSTQYVDLLIYKIEIKEVYEIDSMIEIERERGRLVDCI